MGSSAGAGLGFFESPTAAETDAATIMAQPSANERLQPTFPAVRLNNTPARDSRLSKMAAKEGEMRLCAYVCTI